MALTLEEFSDRELLAAFEDHADADGTVSSAELAEGLGLWSRDGLKHPTQNIAIRLSWLKRYGVLGRDPDSGRWFLTDAGLRVVHGGLRAKERRALEEFSEDALYAAAEQLGRRMVGAQSEAATMAQRSWRYSLAERKRRTGR
jgi:hypothetical protein